MCFGGGGSEPEELESKRAIAEQAAIQLKNFGEVFVPLENQFIGDQLRRFEQPAFDRAMGTAATTAQAAYDEGFMQLNPAMFGRGIDPSSQAFIDSSDSLRKAQARGVGLTAADAGLANTDAAFQGLTNVINMGQGIQQNALEGNIDRLNTSSELARQTAERDFARSSALSGIFGTAAGMASSYGLNRMG